MPRLLKTRTGETVEVDEGGISGAIATGEFTFDPEETYRLRDSDGNLREYSGIAVPYALRTHAARFGDEEERNVELKQQAEEDYYTSTKNQIRAGVVGALRGLRWFNHPAMPRVCCPRQPWK